MSKMKRVSPELYNFLVDFGLTEKEIHLYLSLLKTGPNTIMNVARETGIKRSTTHNNIEELIKKGLVSQTNYGERRMVVAEDPEKLKFLVDQKKWTVRKLEENLDNIVGMINILAPEGKERNRVEVKYFDGITGIKTIYEEALSAKELRSYVNLERAKQYFPENQELFVEGQKRNPDLTIWEIVDDSDLSRQMTKDFSQSKNYLFKLAPKELKLSAADVLIYENKVGIINLSEHPTGIIMYNEDYFNNSKAVFDFIWNVIK